jgi:hypothetical protein
MYQLYLLFVGVWTSLVCGVWVRRRLSFGTASLSGKCRNIFIFIFVTFKPVKSLFESVVDSTLFKVVRCGESTSL